MRRPTTDKPRKPDPAQAGFSLLEVLIGAGLLATALLSHSASIFSEHRLGKAQQARSTALVAAQQFMERLRSDDDWAGLYDRLRDRKILGAQAGQGVELSDGRHAFLPQAYYDDFATPAGLHELHVLVDVPTVPPSGGGALAFPTLREDAPLPAFGLPADLDGDGVIDDVPHEDDYRALPVRVTFRWTAGGEAAEEHHVSTWLWGYR